MRYAFTQCMHVHPCPIHAHAWAPFAHLKAWFAALLPSMSRPRLCAVFKAAGCQQVASMMDLLVVGGALPAWIALNCIANGWGLCRALRSRPALGLPTLKRNAVPRACPR